MSSTTSTVTPGRSTVQRPCQPGEYVGGAPGTDYHVLLEALPHGLHLGGAIDQARSDMLNALAFAAQQEAGDVLAHRPALLGATQPFGQPVEIGRHLAIDALQRMGCHTLRRSRSDRLVKKALSSIRHISQYSVLW